MKGGNDVGRRSEEEGKTKEGREMRCRQEGG